MKVCGLKHRQDVDKLKGLDLDAVGLILVPGRKRSVSWEEAKELVSRLPQKLDIVGVMMDPEPEEIMAWMSLIPLNRIQLHGEESPSLCRQIKEETGISLVKAIHLNEKGEGNPEPEEYAPWVDVVLLDSVLKGVRGGTGVSFPWMKISDYQQRWSPYGIPVWVAGGIHPDNVEKLLHTHQPAGIDVSSGTETEGRKDREKMHQLVKRVRKYDKRRSNSRTSRSLR